jgi:predicted nucleic acid-binding protein
VTSFLLDTSCLVAAALSWHEHHAATRDELRRQARRRARTMVAAHALVEAYSVLTRLPKNKNLAASVAFEVLHANWANAEIVTLDSGEYWTYLRRAAASGVVGGQLHDGLIAACARKAGVDLLLTWNDARFRGFADGFEVRRPKA